MHCFLCFSPPAAEIYKSWKLLFQGEEEFEAAFGSVFGVDFAVVEEDGMLDDGEAEAGAAVGAGAALADADEAVEESGEVVVGDAAAGVVEVDVVEF